MSDIWNQKRKQLEEAVKQAAMDLCGHMGCDAFSLPMPIPGFSVSLSTESRDIEDLKKQVAYLSQALTDANDVKSSLQGELQRIRSGHTATVEYDLSPAMTEGAISQKLIELGWTPPDKLSEQFLTAWMGPRCGAQYPPGTPRPGLPEHITDGIQRAIKQATAGDQDNIGWNKAKELSEAPAIHEALTNFSHDSTEDNAVAIVQAVAGALAVPRPPVTFSDEDITTAWLCLRKNNHTISDEALDGMRDTLRAALSAPSVPEGWRPIETAPVDGTAVLVMRDIWPGTASGRAEQCVGYNTYVAEWWADEEGGNGKWVCYMDAVLDPVCPIEPTHWMPLPHPPSRLTASPEPVAQRPIVWQYTDEHGEQAYTTIKTKALESDLHPMPLYAEPVAPADDGFIDIPANLRRQTNVEQHSKQVIADLRAELAEAKMRVADLEAAPVGRTVIARAVELIDDARRQASPKDCDTSAFWSALADKLKSMTEEAPLEQNSNDALRAEVETLKEERMEIATRLAFLESQLCFDDRWERLPSGHHHGRPISREKLAARLAKFDAARLREGGES